MNKEHQNNISLKYHTKINKKASTLDLSTLLSIDVLLTLATLIFLEIILGIDNIVMISILSERLPKENQKQARKYGILFAAITRIGLLFTLNWIATLTNPILELGSLTFSYKDLLFITGGLFLMYKTVPELVEIMGLTPKKPIAVKSDQKAMIIIILQIGLFDIIFSLDSIITAIGLSQYLWIMIVSILIAVVVMLVFTERVTILIEKYHSIKILALCFLFLIAAVIILDGFSLHISKSYIFSMILFSLVVELINIKTDHHKDKIN